jgi:hypothetical protein
MKKTFAMLLAAVLLLGVLAGCGGSTGGNEPAESVTVDLTAFYDGLSAEYEWVPEGMMDLAADEEMLEAFFPGLKDIPVKQLVLRTPMMSAVVNEIALVECENEADAAKVAEILRGRVTAQAEGGAWYPESIEGWEKNSRIVTNGNYVMMIAWNHCDEAVEAFNALF